VALHNHETPLDPDWWLLRLGRRMRLREDKKLKRWKGYYTGDGQLLPQGPSASGKVYEDFQRKARTNFCQLPVEADVNRLLGIGFTGPDGKALDVPWQWWKQNRLNARQKTVYRTALSLGEAYVSVGRHPRDPTRPLIVPEHPRQVIVEDDPATRERRAGLKAYYDDILKCGRAFVDTGEVIVEYRTEQRSGSSRLPWGEQNWTIHDAQTNPAGKVAFIPFRNQPDMEDDPIPVFARVTDIQDRINFGVLNRMTVERKTAFNQWWFTGGEVPKIVDDETGIEMPVNPWNPEPGTVLVHESEHGKFGQFSQTDMMGYLKVYEADIRTMFVLTATPAYYMPGDLINIATDTVTALDTNHVAKVEEEQAFFGEGWEDVVDVSAAMVGYDGDELNIVDMRWKDARQLNPAVVADFGTKRKSMGYPLTMVAEDMGDSPARVERLRTEQAAEELRTAALARRQQQANAPRFQEPSDAA
jgi:hypothetical protein